MADDVPQALEPALPENVGLGDGPVLAGQIDNLGKGKYAKADDDQWNPVHQVETVKRNSVFSGSRCTADTADEKAEAAGGQSLGEASPGKDTDHTQTHDCEHEQLSRAKGKNHRPGNENKTSEYDRPEKTAKQRGRKGSTQRPGSLPFLGQGKSIQGLSPGRRWNREYPSAPK